MASASLTTDILLNSTALQMSTYNSYVLFYFWQSQTNLFLFITNIILALPANLYVIWLITMGAESGVAEFFALSISICETITCVGSIPYISYIFTTDTCMNCSFYYIASFFLGLLSYGRPLFQCCVCVERYVAVVHPITFLKYKSLRYRMTSTAVVWFILLGFCLSNMLYFTEIWMYCVMLPYYFLLFIIKVVCSVAVLRALRQPGPGWSARDAEANRLKKKAFWIIGIILVATVINIGPIVFLIFCYSVLSEMQRQEGLATVFSFIILSGFVHPLLYLHRARKHYF